MQLTILFVYVSFAFASAVPLLVEDEEGQQYYMAPVLSRQRREGPQIFGGGAATGKQQSGTVGFQNPNGSGASLSHGHANGYGHDVSFDARVPIWSKRHGLEESTINLGGGTTQHFGGWGGNRQLDKRAEISFNHRF